MFVSQTYSPYIQNFRLLNVPNENEWERILSEQERDATFASTVFCYAAASMLNVEIRITTLRSTQQHPTYALNPEATSGAIMILGNITDFHFQSLIPSNDAVLEYQTVNITTVGSTDNEKLRKRTSNHSSSSENFCKINKLPRTIPSNNEGTIIITKNLTESKIKNICLESKVTYIQPPLNESSDNRTNRIGCLRRKVYHKTTYEPKVQSGKRKRNIEKKTETEIKKMCEEGNIPYVPSYEGETVDDQLRRYKGLKRRITYKNYNSKRIGTNSPSQNVPPSNNNHSSISTTSNQPQHPHPFESESV